MPIRVLPQEIAAKIAAGEVVERPVSVVKELIENSIDAGAQAIIIRIEGAGLRLIEVVDDGAGIPSEEISLAIKRYATSKIDTFEDLNVIRTLGFRGEALASIAAVSRFSLESRTAANESGMKLSVDGGSQISLISAGMKKGTRVRVENLFFNVPARKKFMKSETTERKLITEIITRYALFYASIRFQLTQEGRQVFSSFGNGNRREILSIIYDLQTAQKYLEVDFQDLFVKITGYTSPLDITYANRKQIYCFVNGRLVSDPTITAAIIRAYQGYLMVGRFPATVLFIDMSPEDIDVNVHPTKDEIRFRDSGRIFSVIHSALRGTLSDFLPLSDLQLPTWNSRETTNMTIDPAWEFIRHERFPEPVGPMPATEAPQQEPAGIISKVPILRLIGQLGRTYIAAEGPDGLYLIDQHAAHERILYERMQNQPKTEPISQFLLSPETLTLPPHYKEIFKQQREILEKIGYQFENFGPDTIRFSAVPAVIQNMNPSEGIMSALEPDNQKDSILDDTLDKRIILKICKSAAIKGGQILDTKEQEQLIRDLENCESPRTCPHGRPTMIHISVDLLARQFGRLGSR